MRSALLAVSLVALAGCGGARSSGTVSNQATKADRAIPNDPLALIPVDSEVVVHVDVQRLRASSTWQFYEPRLLAEVGPSLAAFKAQCGFDPLEALKFAAVGLRNISADAPSGVVVMRGLDRGKTMKCIEQNVAKAQGELVIDRDVVLVRSGTSEAAFTFADPSTLVGIIGKATTADLDRLLTSGVPLKGSPAFNEILKQLRVADPLWFVMNGNAKLFDRATSFGIKRPKALFGSIDLAAGLAALIRIRLDAPADAQALANLANGQLGMAKGFFDRLEATTDRADVVLEARMTQSQLDAMVKMAGGMVGSGLGGP